MKFIDEFRQPKLCRQLIDKILRTAERPWTLMEVCGGQTHGLLRFGIDEALSDAARLIHGPGCPVCVTPISAINAAITLASQRGVTLTSFGDMLRVPGSNQSLLEARAAGASVKIVYSPLDAVQYARAHPQEDVVFFAVGFETTAPATALAVKQAAGLGLRNFSLLVSHVRVLPAMELLARCKENSVEGFLAAGHVCTVTGYRDYERFVADYNLPVVVTGFEPVDLLTGILMCIEQLEMGVACVINAYGRSVAAEGNRDALELMSEVYEPVTRPWRGLGAVPDGGLKLRARWQQFDAEHRFGIVSCASPESNDCRSGEVLIGKIKPTECEHFGSRCSPDAPLGAPMVSAEGACAAYFRYRGVTDCQVCRASDD